MALQEDTLYVGFTRSATMMGVSYGAFISSMIIAALSLGFLGWLFPNPFYGIVLFFVLIGLSLVIEKFDRRIYRMLYLWIITGGRCPLRLRLYWKGDTRSPMMRQRKLRK